MLTTFYHFKIKPELIFLLKTSIVNSLLILYFQSAIIWPIKIVIFVISVYFQSQAALLVCLFPYPTWILWLSV